MGNPLALIPASVRLVAYVVYGMVSLVLAYLAHKGVVGPDEVELWLGIGTFLGITAASNVNLSEPRSKRGRRGDLRF